MGKVVVPGRLARLLTAAICTWTLVEGVADFERVRRHVPVPAVEPTAAYSLSLLGADLITDAVIVATITVENLSSQQPLMLTAAVAEQAAVLDVATSTRAAARL